MDTKKRPDESPEHELELLRERVDRLERALAQVQEELRALYEEETFDVRP